MLVSTKGRYALRVMLKLAEASDEEYILLDTIAQEECISEKYLETIARILVKGGMIQGLRGRGGGYRLTRKADAYTVGEILRITEGSLAPVSCLEGPGGGCPRAGRCKTLPMWKKLDSIICDYLDHTTLTDLLESACLQELP